MYYGNGEKSELLQSWVRIPFKPVGIFFSGLIFSTACIAFNCSALIFLLLKMLFSSSIYEILYIYFLL